MIWCVTPSAGASYRATCILTYLLTYLMDWSVDTTDLSLDHRWVRWWEMRPILDAQTWLQVSQVNPWSGDSWRPVLCWTRLSWSDSIRRRSKSDTSCFLKEDRQEWMTCLLWGLELVGRQIAGSHVRLQHIFEPLQLTAMGAGIPCSSSE